MNEILASGWSFLKTDLNQLQTITPSLAAAGGLNILYRDCYICYRMNRRQRFECAHIIRLFMTGHILKGKGVISRKISHEFAFEFWIYDSKLFPIHIFTLLKSWRASESYFESPSKVHRSTTGPAKVHQRPIEGPIEARLKVQSSIHRHSIAIEGSFWKVH